jgi:hypothetical protein
MSKSLWVQYAAASEANLVDYVSFEGLSSISEFKVALRNKQVLAIPEKARITIYKSDGVTEIDVDDSPAAYLNGNSRSNPLVVKAILRTILSPFEQQLLPVNISNQDEDLRSVHESYVRIGELLKDEPIVREIWNTLQSLKGNPIPFVFIEESSGAGKTQIAFALKNLITCRHPEVKFLYFVSSSRAVNTHKIYKVFK